MMIVNDDSRVINKLEASLTDDARVVIYDRHMFIVQATGHTGPLNLWFMLFSEWLGAVVAYQSGQGENDGESDASRS
jgi:hypothetical protein